MQSRSLINRSNTYVKDKVEQHLDNLRATRLLKKSDGLSEFFKGMASVEKGNGEINDIFPDHGGGQNKEGEVE